MTKEVVTFKRKPSGRCSDFASCQPFQSKIEECILGSQVGPKGNRDLRTGTMFDALIWLDVGRSNRNLKSRLLGSQDWRKEVVTFKRKPIVDVLIELVVSPSNRKMKHQSLGQRWWRRKVMIFKREPFVDTRIWRAVPAGMWRVGYLHQRCNGKVATCQRQPIVWWFDLFEMAFSLSWAFVFVVDIFWIPKRSLSNA